MKKILQEFKTFALRGNVTDLAVGIIIGASFNSIVNSLVNDIIMPPIGLILGQVDFSELYINLGSGSFESLSAAKEAGAPVVSYGLFINALISFLITAFAVFILVRIINKLKSKEEKNPQPTPSTKPCPYCFNQVPIKATRCPFCTSIIEEEGNIKKV